MIVAVLLGVAIILMPVAFRNLAVGGGFHLTTSQFGPNFYIGNHAGASGTYEALVAGHGSAADEREDATRLAEQQTGRRLTAAEVSGFWTRRALDDIRSRPREWIALVARKLALTFNAAEIADTESPDVYAEWSWLLRVLSPFNFGVLAGLAAFGAVLTARAWRRLWILYAIALTYALSVVVFYVFARYRFPIVPVLMIFAAGGLIGVLNAVNASPQLRPGRFAIALIAAIAAFGCAHLPLADERGSRATHYTGIATALAKDPAQQEQAMMFYSRALDEVPRLPDAEFGIAKLLTEKGRHGEAIPHYRAALDTWPTHAEGHYNLGLALAATGQHEDARQHFVEAVRLRPDDVDAHLALAKAQLALQRPDLAADEYRQVLAGKSDDVRALIGLGVALTHLGRADEAIAHYRRALAIDPHSADAHNNLGFTLASDGRIAEAIPHFERAVVLNPGNENARLNLERARQMLR